MYEREQSVARPLSLLALDSAARSCPLISAPTTRCDTGVASLISLAPVPLPPSAAQLQRPSSDRNPPRLPSRHPRSSHRAAPILPHHKQTPVTAVHVAQLLEINPLASISSPELPFPTLHVVPADFSPTVHRTRLQVAILLPHQYLTDPGYVKTSTLHTRTPSDISGPQFRQTQCSHSGLLHSTPAPHVFNCAISHTDIDQCDTRLGSTHLPRVQYFPLWSPVQWTHLTLLVVARQCLQSELNHMNADVFHI
jgi:hypothetical protein